MNDTGLSAQIPQYFLAAQSYTVTRSFGASPQLTIVGTGGSGGDVTAFIDQVEVLSGGSVFANGLQNSSFESYDALANGDYGYVPSGANWTFSAQSGIAKSSSAFAPTAPLPNGAAVAFIQGTGQFQQNLKVPTGSSYQVRLQTSQRNCCSLSDQALNVFLEGVYLGKIQPTNGGGYATFTSPAIAVTAPALTAVISSTASNPTASAPIPFTVTFSQAVTGFTAGDIVATNGTVGNFAGSGTTYTFNVSPTAGGAVKINIAANAAIDDNNTGNTVATEFNITATPTAAPVVSTPATNTFVANTTPTYTGTAVAASTVTVYVDGTSIGTATTNGAGEFILIQPTALAAGAHTVYATAQTSGSVVSANSSTNTFTVDTTRSSVTITSTAGASGATTANFPVPVTVTFSEAVTGFVLGDITRNNGSITNFSGSGTTYTFTFNPTANRVATIDIPANVAQDVAANFNTAASPFSVTYAVTAAPTVATPVNASLIATTTSSYTGTAVANSTVTIAVDGVPIGSTTATAGGNYTLLQPTALNQGSHTVYVTAQASGSAESQVSSNTFTVDSTRPTVVITSTAGATSSTTATSPIPIKVTFSEAVTGFVAGDLTLTNGTIGTISGSGTTYTLNLTPTGFGQVTVAVPANVAQDAAANGNTAALQFMINYQQVLPVSLVAFTAKAEGSAAKLEWATASEQQNNRFEIERSVDGQHFALLGMVKGNGTSAIRNNYFWYDRSPLAGTNYYKLAQVDDNGNRKELAIKTVDFKLKENIAISVYPNPASEQATVNFSLGSTKIEVVDLGGKVLFTVALGPNDTTYEINLQQLTPAVYIVRVYHPKGVLVTRLIKL